MKNLELVFQQLELVVSTNGSSFKDHLEKFEQDDETKVILMIGEIGGPQEAEAAEFAKANVTKPVIAYIVTAPKGKRMGHAGAIVSSKGESAADSRDSSSGWNYDSKKSICDWRYSRISVKPSRDL